MDEFDILIENALKEEVNPSELDIENNLLKLKTDLVNNNKKSNFKRFSYMNFKKVAVITTCCLICIITLLISSSSTVRAIALDALDNIKLIFVVEESSDNVIKIVQKTTSEVYFAISDGHNTYKSDAELGKIIGYKIQYPKTLADGFELRCRALHVSLGKELSYDVIPQIRQQLNKAIENQEEFKKLDDYSPYRNVSGIYAKGKRTIYIDTSPAEFSTPFNSPEKEEIKIGDIKGIWCKSQSPVYPYKNGKFDMSVKPTIENTYLLYWINNDIHYSLSATDENTLSKEDAIKIATEFQAAQP